MFNLKEALGKFGDEELADRLQKQKNKPAYFAGRTKFPRFSRYELKESVCAPFFRIVPTIDARVEWYSPFDYEPKMLRDYLNVVADLQHYKTQEEKEFVPLIGLWNGYGESCTGRNDLLRRLERDAPIIFGFCEKYGPLTGPNMEYLQDSYEIEGLLLKQEPSSLIEHFNIDLQEFERVFQEEIRAAETPFDNWIIRAFRGLRLVNSSRDLLASRTKKERFEAFWGPDGQNVYAYGDSISPWYSDNLSAAFMDWQVFTSGGYKPNEAYAGIFDPEGDERWIDRISDFRVKTELFMCHEDGQWKLDYNTSTLQEALGIMLLNSMTGAGDQIKKCALEECGKAFITSDPRAHYCCPRHSQRGRIRKWRAAQKTVVKTVGELSTKQGKTGEKPRKRKTL